MSQLVPEPCPHCKGKRRYGAGRAPCICTLGTGEVRGAVVIRPPKLTDNRRTKRSPLRPVTRADCANVPRPCPFVGCRWNTYLEGHGKDLKITAPHRYPWDVPPGESCVLDIAEGGPVTLERISEVLNCTRERIRQVEVMAMEHCQESRDRMKGPCDE